MTRRPTSHPTCPDCGGILQPTEPERLTTGEIAASDAGEDHEASPRQCLICGYQETGTAAAARGLTLTHGKRS
jgi:hypothetical protein